MANIKEYVPTELVTKIYQSYEKRRQHGHRPHMGGSQVGHHCDRFLWYQFRWADSESFEGKGRLLRLFDHGDKEEERLVDDLRAIGATVLPIDTSTGKQWHFEAFGGHFACNLDGVAHNMPGLSGWFMLEFKTANQKSFDKLTKCQSVKEWNEQYYGQVQTGLRLSGLPACVHITVCKNTDDIYQELIPLDEKEAKRLLGRAERIIFTNEPPERCTNDPTFWRCKFCQMYGICWGSRAAQANMRTCVHATPTKEGRWCCEKCKEYKTTEQQREPCKHHLMRPDLVPYAKAIDHGVTDGEGWIKYESENGVFYNSNLSAKGHYTSQEMHAFKGVLPIKDETLDQLRETFDARLVGGGDK